MERQVSLVRAILASMLVVVGCVPASAFAPDGCEQQRAQYPANWNDTAREKPLFTCTSHYGAPYRLKLGESDSAGRTLMSVVPLSRPGLVEKREDVLRIWLDRDQKTRLLDGKYFGTILRKETSCWIRGDLSDDVVFFMDNAKPPADEPDKAGEFYNKAPRFSVFGSNAYSCEPVK